MSAFDTKAASRNSTFYHVHLYTHRHQNLFGEPLEGCTHLNLSGQIVIDEWRQIAMAHQRDIKIDCWSVEPNGIHALLAVIDDDGPPPCYAKEGASPKPRSLSLFVAGFKAAAAKRINLVRGLPGNPVWQRSYYEKPIHNPQLLLNLRQQLAFQFLGGDLCPGTDG